MTVFIAELREPVSQALRRLCRDWAFTAAFVLTLALGISANLAVLSALDAYFLRPLPYPQGGALLDLSVAAEKYPVPPGWMSAPIYERLRAVRALSSSGLEAGWGDLTVAVAGEPPANDAVDSVTASTLETLGTKPLLGRFISRASDRAGGPPEVDVSYGLWQSAFHGNAQVLGRTLTISGKPYTVVGVMPQGFAFPTRDTQLWVPIALTPEDIGPKHLTDFNYTMIGRLRPGASRAQLDTELAGVLARLEQSLPVAERIGFRRFGAYFDFVPLRQYLGGATRGRLLMMQSGAAVLLLLAVSSLINLALARALRRRDEAALRVVLGAGRAVLIRHALLEALPLGVVATVVAWPLTEAAMRAFIRFGIGAAGTTFALHTGPMLWALALAAALALSAAALALPLAFVSVDRPAELLHGTETLGKGHRMRTLRLALSVGQIALAIALLSGALLLGRSLRNMLDSNPGFDSRGLYSAMLLLQGPQYENWGTWRAAHQRLAAAVAALPGVRESGIGEAVPFAGDSSASAFRPAQERTGSLRAPLGEITLAGPGLLKTLGVHLLAGRLLDATDAATNAPNVVIDERFAQALFGTHNVVDRTLKCSIRPGTCRIVGVIGTIHDRFARHGSSGSVFVPEEPNTFRLWSHLTTLTIRSSLPPASLAREMRSVVHRTLPDQSLIAFASMSELISDSARGAAAVASLLISFGLLAFTLAVIGTYGVVAYVTGLRRREFAVRQAVGAEPVQIESLVLGQGLLLWALGTMVGVGCALIFARSLAVELYRVSPFTPSSYALPAVVVGVAVMLASWIPARSARKLDLIAQIRPE